jgi:dihydroflavonol-4-reductase
MFAAVTGASGHLGSNLVRILIEKGWQVRALVHYDTRGIDGLDIERVHGDVLDRDSLINAFYKTDVVFHLAGRISIIKRDSKEVEAVNISGVQNVINACLKNQVKRLVHVSSFHAHEQAPLDKPLDESRPLLEGRGFPPYNHSKAEGERLVRASVEKGMDAIIINPGGMLGPNDFKPSHFGETILSIARRKLPALVNAGLCWVDIRDVAEGMINACENAVTGSKYILSGKYVSLKEIGDEVANIIGVKPPRLILPLWLAKWFAPSAEFIDQIRGKRPQFTPIAMNELESNRFIRYSKATKEFGYQPRPLKQTLTDTVEWFRTNNVLK